MVNVSLCFPFFKVEKVCTGGHTDVLLYPAKKMQHLVTSGIDHEGTSQNLTSSKADPFLKPVMETRSASLNSDFKQKVAEILFKYSNGLWANALPKVYEDTYKVKFPEDALNNLDLLSDICTVNQISDSPKKAILYAKPQKYIDENLNATDRVHIPEDLKITVEQECSQLMEKTKEQGPENIMVPPLIIPAEASPSVLVVELNNTNEVVIRQVFISHSFFTFSKIQGSFCTINFLTTLLTKSYFTKENRPIENSTNRL